MVASINCVLFSVFIFLLSVAENTIRDSSHNVKYLLALHSIVHTYRNNLKEATNLCNKLPNVSELIARILDFPFRERALNYSPKTNDHAIRDS